MRATIETKLKIASWDEKPTQTFEDGSKITRASVVLTEGTDGLTRGTFDAVMYYRPDETSAYVALMRVSATLDGRSGTFVAAGDGGFDGTTASSVSQILPDSGIRRPRRHQGPGDERVDPRRLSVHAADGDLRAALSVPWPEERPIPGPSLEVVVAGGRSPSPLRGGPGSRPG